MGKQPVKNVASKTLSHAEKKQILTTKSKIANIWADKRQSAKIHNLQKVASMTENRTLRGFIKKQIVAIKKQMQATRVNVRVKAAVVLNPSALHTKVDGLLAPTANVKM